MKTLIFQSYKTSKPAWIIRCQTSVQDWASLHGYEYRCIGDEIFSLNPSWFNEKMHNRMPIKSDLARLLYAQEALQHYNRVIWFDIDCYIFAPNVIQLPSCSYLFGQERWIQPHKKSWKIYKNVCNAFFLFHRDNPFLSFYIDTAMRLSAEINPDYIPPQFIGPKLLSALHSAVTLPISTMVGSASPWLLQECAQEKQHLLNKIAHSITGDPCGALNLSNSLITDTQITERAMRFLQQQGAIGGS